MRPSRGSYIDLDREISCDPKLLDESKGRDLSSWRRLGGQPPYWPSAVVNPTERPQFVDIGAPEAGFLL